MKKQCRNCFFVIRIDNVLRCTNPLNANGVNINMRSNRACNQDWHLTPIYVSFEVDKDDTCGGFKEND
jgi:hypothetical protein